MFLNQHFSSFVKQQGYVTVILMRSINTNGGQRKGKLSVVRKKIDRQEFTVEALQTKTAASAIKQFNWENKYLFGEIVTAVQHTCKVLTKRKRISHKVPEDIIICAETSIPIQDVKTQYTIQPQGTSGDPITITVPPVQSTNSIADDILNFPLMDKLPNKENASEITYKMNSLRQYLESLCKNKFPSVTAILERTMPPERMMYLERWKSSMVEQMGKEQFEKYQKDMLFNGSALHQSINAFLSKIPELKVEVLPANAGHWTSLQSVLPLMKDVKLLEEHVTHPFLCYKGVVDCFGKYKDHFVVVDWKTSKKPKMSLALTYDSPLQIAAYVGALNFDSKFKYMANKGVIVVAYENGSPATVHFMNEKVLMENWQKWLQRLKTYWEKMESP